MQKRIIIADDHPVFRLGLRTAIKKCGDFIIAGEASTGVELLELINIKSCDLVILDMKMPDDDDGIILLKKIKNRKPEIKVVIMSQYYKKFVVEKAAELGVDGYLTKDEISGSIIPILKQVLDGNRYLSPKVRDALSGEIEINGEKICKLTKREKEILKLITSGYRRKQISEKLFISIPTVDFHLTNIKHKLHAHTVAEIIRKSNELGLV